MRISKPKPKTFSKNKKRVFVSNELLKVIQQFQKKMTDEEIKKYNKYARDVTSVWASDEVAKFVRKMLK